jgi:hypothetical protein
VSGVIDISTVRFGGFLIDDFTSAQIKRLISADMSITPLTDYFSKQMVCQLHHSMITSVNR